MSVEYRPTQVMGRKSIRQSTPTQLSESVQSDEVQDDSSSSTNTSKEMSPESFPEKNNSKVYDGQKAGLSPPHGFQHSSCKNPVSNQKPSYTDEITVPKKGFERWVLLLLALIIAVIGIGSMWASGESDCMFKTLSQKNPGQDGKIWETLSTGINNIKHKRSNQPGVYLFIAEDGSKLKRIVKSIAEHTSQCFDNNMELIEMTENDFTSSSTIEDYGNAVEKFKEKIKKGRVALIVNLNKIPAESARALHTICDTYSPVAVDIVIYLTLVVPSSMDKPVQVARNTLTDLWASKLKSNELDPLLTRVMDEVIAIQ